MFTLSTAAPKVGIQQALITSNVHVLFPMLIVIKCNRDHSKLESIGHGSELGCTVLGYPYFLSFIFHKFVQFCFTSVVCIQSKRKGDNGKTSSAC